MNDYKNYLFKLYLGYIFLFLNISCESKPEKVPFPNHFEPNRLFEETKLEEGMRGLWFTGTNFVSGGYLGRIDLLSGEIRSSILPVGPDTLVLPDLFRKNIFILSRSQHDGIGIMNADHSKIEAYYAFPKDSNPQSAVRDSEGRVWVTLFESNEVQVLSPDLSHKVGGVDLSLVAPTRSKDSLADLGPIAFIDNSTILVGALQLDREMGSWNPSKNSNLVEIDPSTLLVKKISELAISNPLLISHSKDKTFLVGRGDFTNPKDVSGAFWVESPTNSNILKHNFFGGAIVAADINRFLGEPVVAVWYPSNKQSCIYVGIKQILCDGNEKNDGYIFTNLLSQGNIIFVAYTSEGFSELWIIPINQPNQIKKLVMTLPIFSLSFGP